MLVSGLVIHGDLVNAIRHLLRVDRAPTLGAFFLQRNVDNFTHGFGITRCSVPVALTVCSASDYSGPPNRKILCPFSFRTTLPSPTASTVAATRTAAL
jgi:hypothetical protein